MEPLDKGKVNLLDATLQRLFPTKHDEWLHLERPFSDVFSEEDMNELDDILAGSASDGEIEERCYVDVMQSIADLFTPHLAFVGVELNFSVRMAAQSETTDIDSAEAVDTATMLDGQAWADWKPHATPLRVDDLLVMPPSPWQRVRIHVEEHFADANLQSEPSAWKWLCEHSHYLVVLPVNQIYLHTGDAVQYLMRRLSALARCFGERGFDYGDIDPKVVVAGFQLAGNFDGPAGCRYLSVPLRKKDLAALNARLLHGSTDIEHGHFRLARPPFGTIAEIGNLENAGFISAWRWVSEDDSTSAAQVRRALDCFDGAYGLLHVHSNVPSDVQGSWSCLP